MFHSTRVEHRTTRQRRLAVVLLGMMAALGAISSPASGEIMDATARNAGDDAFTFGTSVTVDVLNGGSYAGIGSRVVAAEGGATYLGSQMVLLGGANTTGSTATVNMAWRNRTNLEINTYYPLTDTWANPYYVIDEEQQFYQDGQGYGGVRGMALSHDSYNVISDAVQFSGISGVYVMQMTYDDTVIFYDDPYSTEASFAARGEIYLGWLSVNNDSVGRLAGYDEWVRAVDGNSSVGSLAIANFQGTYSDFCRAHSDVNDNLADYLGTYGIDTDSNVVWAVLDHNSEFGVVPEPATLVVLTIGLLVLNRRRIVSIP